jgi:hypothetical protein
VDSGGSRDAATRLPVARSDRWGTTWSLAAARHELWATVISRRLTAAPHERWGTTVSRRLAAARRELWGTAWSLAAARRKRRAASFVPGGCRVDGGGADIAADW